MRQAAKKRWMNPEAKAVGERLRKLRQERGWTQLDLATQAEMERTAIANYEQGVCFPPVPALRKLARALKVSVDELISEDAKPEKALRDPKLLELFTRVDQLGYRVKAIVEEVVDGLLAKHEKEHRSSH
jgi:transcriptional regulator with XRE-family HTH domain